MSFNFVDPYTGKDAQTCSASVKAQNEMGAHTTGSSQTEAQFNTSKQLGEWGVIVAKLGKGEIPNGTKVLTYTKPSTGGRGYLYVKNGGLWKKVYDGEGKLVLDEESGYSFGEAFIASANFDTTIPQAVKPNPKPEPVPFTEQDGKDLSSDVTALKNGQVLALAPSGDYILYNTKQDKFELYTKGPAGYGHTLAGESYYMPSLMSGNTWNKPGKTTTDKPAPSVIASPTPSPAVTPGSASVGSMSHEDVAAMFVKIKDDLAKEQGLNIKGANPDLDLLVYKAIGEKTGYTGAEVKAKIDAYKAEGNKLSALKKKVLAGTKKVPEGKPQPTKATPAAPLNTGHTTNKPATDPKPNGVPTTATPKLADEAKAEVKKVVDANPAKVYIDEDVAAAYIIAKDAIVANNTKGWTLYTKNPEMDAAIAAQVGNKTGLTTFEQKQAIANYLASGKKLSALKKQLAKQGAFTPQADSLKKSGAEKDAAAKAKDVDAKADAGYTPTPEPATKAKAGEPKVDTGKPAPRTVVDKAQESGDISGISQNTQQVLFNHFKGKGSLSYLSSTSGQNYDAFAEVQASFPEYTLLQLIRVVDQYGAKKAGVDNGKLFEKKVATWLTTPEGTAHLKANEVKLAKLAEQAKKKAEAEAAAKLLEANQPPLPADSAQFEDWSLAKATRISNTWLEAQPFTAAQKAGLRHYTGSAYREMNGYLRGTSTTISGVSKGHIQGAKDGMRPTTEPILVKRGTGANQFLTLGVERGDTSLLWGITGKTFKDEGFLSTSAGGRAAFGGECRLEIECPVGTPMMYVDPFSKHPGENEMMLQAGLEYKILNVRKEGNQFVIRCRVVNWPGKGK